MEVLFAIVGLSGVTLAVGWFWFEPVRRARRALERAKNTPIALLPQHELAKITGVIAPREAMLKSPVEKQPCIGYTTRIFTSKDDQGSEFKTAWCASFLVTDETGTAAVAGPVFIVPLPDQPSQFAPDWLYERGTVGESTTYRETVLKPGDRVSVLGRATLEADPAGHGSFRAPPTRLWIRGAEAKPVIVAHVPGWT